MCEYRKENKCQVTQEVCPWVYWCDKVGAWKPLAKAPKECKVKQNATVPKGMYRVAFERRGYLYVEVDNQTIKLPNPFDHIPMYVGLYKNKGTYKIKKGKENKE